MAKMVETDEEYLVLRIGADRSVLVHGKSYDAEAINDSPPLLIAVDSLERKGLISVYYGNEAGDHSDKLVHHIELVGSAKAYMSEYAFRNPEHTSKVLKSFEAFQRQRDKEGRPVLHPALHLSIDTLSALTAICGPDGPISEDKKAVVLCAANTAKAIIGDASNMHEAVCASADIWKMHAFQALGFPGSNSGGREQNAIWMREALRKLKEAVQSLESGL